MLFGLNCEKRVLLIGVVAVVATADPEVKDRRGQTDNPGDGRQQNQPQDKRQRDAHAPCRALLMLGQFRRCDGDEE